MWLYSIVMFYPCLFCPSDNVCPSRRADVPWWAHFSTVIPPSWNTQQISVEKCAHRGASACREPQTMFKIVTWTKQTWTNHYSTKVRDGLPEKKVWNIEKDRENFQGQIMVGRPINQAAGRPQQMDSRHLSQTFFFSSLPFLHSSKIQFLNLFRSSSKDRGQFSVMQINPFLHFKGQICACIA